MPEFLEDMIGICLKTAASEGRRILGEEAIRVLENVVDGLRRLVIIQYVVMCACFLWASSFLACGWLLTARWEAVRANEWPPELIFTFVVWVASTVALTISVQRSIWLRALGAARKAAMKPLEPPAPLTEAQVAAVVERTVREEMGRVIGDELRSALREQSEKAREAQ